MYATPINPYSPGTLYGLTLSNNTTDPTNDIDIAVGAARNSIDTANIDLLTGLTKRADAAWAAGTGNGGRLYATLVDGSIHMFLIKNPTTGVVDVGFSDNATNPTGGANYPSGFTLYRRIGSIARNAGVMRQFYQIGDTFYWVVPLDGGTFANPGTAAVTGTAGIPTGIIVQAVLAASVNDTAAAAFTILNISPLAIADTAPGTAAFTAFTGSNSGSTFGSTVYPVFTNTSAQFRWRISQSNANITFRFNTIGWIDTRGRIS